MSDTDVLAVLAVLAAPVFASFCALVVDRLPRGEPVVASRSRCRSCGRALNPAELLPILSFFLRRGRCRSCGAPIPRWMLYFELAALCLALQGALAVGGGWLAAATMMLAVTLLSIATIDARHFIIPDVFSLPLIPAGLAVAALDPRLAPLDHLIGAAAGTAFLALVAVAYSRLRGREGLGLGDAKLFGAAGAWVGWQGLPFVLLIGSVGGLLAVFVLRLGGRRLALGDALPFGPFLALGFWLVWLYHPPL